VLALLALAIGSPTAIYNAIIEEMRSGNLATACVQAADLAKSHPTFFGGFHLLGICETQRGKLEAASLQFQRCLDLNPRYIDARVNLANNLLRLGRDNEAARQFGAVLKVNPGHLSSLTNMAALERNRGRPCDAAIYLRRANSLARQEAAITVSLAEALLGCGQAAEAERLLRPLETAYSSNARWNALAGEAAYRIGQPKPAMARLRRALELDPKVQRYWMIAGELLLASESDRAAAAFFETGLKNLPDSPALHTGLAVAYLAGGARTEDALVHLKQALALDSGFEPALLALCRAAEQVRDAGRCPQYPNGSREPIRDVSSQSLRKSTRRY
jgi:predicted Zn-dependent protease